MRFVLIGAFLLIVGVSSYYSFAKYEDVERLEASVIATVQSDGMERIWFAPSGELVGIGRQDSRLTVRVWSPAGALVRERVVTLPPVKSPAVPVFAVSAEGVQAAWADDAGAHVANLSGGAPQLNAIPAAKKTAPITGLAFTGPGTLAVLYENGELALRDLNSGRVAATTKVDMADPDRLLASGVYLTAYASASGTAFVFDTTGNRFSLVENRRFSPDNLTMTLSPGARFAVGTRDGVEQLGNRVRAPGPVHGIAFIDRDHILVAGDFQGIYLLSTNQGPQQITGSGQKFSLLAFGGTRLAFGDGRSVSIASGGFAKVHRSAGWDPPFWFWVIFFIAILPLTLYFLYGVIGFILRKLFTMNPPPAHEPEKPKEEGPIPDALVEACHNGECVLWAGTGLGAQAGLPVWTPFVRELADWAAKLQLEPDSMAAELAEIPEGKPGPAADRLAAAFSGERKLLQGYLRQRFLFYAELPAAHQRIKEIDFPTLITTGFDNLLDRTFPQSGGRVYTAGSCEGFGQAVARRDFLLLKPFGNLEEPDTIRLGPAECDSVIRENVAFRELMEQLFNDRVFLFIGTSLEGLERDLAAFGLPQQVAKKHYALVPATAPHWKATSLRLEVHYGIQALPYTPTGSQHLEVVDFLTTLLGLIHEKSSTKEYFETRE